MAEINIDVEEALEVVFKVINYELEKPGISDSWRSKLIQSKALLQEALFGDLSGTYLAITVQLDNKIFIEIVRCKHVGRQLRGEIDGVCCAKYKERVLSKIGPTSTKYNFNGTVDNYLLKLSYYETGVAAKGSGTLTLQGDGEGKRFTGVWAGSAGSQLVSSSCIWARVTSEWASSATEETLIQEVERVLAEYGFPAILEELNKIKSDNTRRERIQGLRKQLEIYYRNLNNLETKAAKCGIINIPTNLRNEIEETKKKIAEIEGELGLLRGK